MLWVSLLILGVALLVLAGRGIGAQVSFGGRERPERIVGTKVVLFEFDGLGSEAPAKIEATVKEYLSTRVYILEFAASHGIVGKNETSAKVSARHAGYPVSSASRRGILAVAGELQSGTPFIAQIQRSGAGASEA